VTRQSREQVSGVEQQEGRRGSCDEGRHQRHSYGQR
jgi:hypothetical protein